MNTAQLTSSLFCNKMQCIFLFLARALHRSSSKVTLQLFPLGLAYHYSLLFLHTSQVMLIQADSTLIYRPVKLEKLVSAFSSISTSWRQNISTLCASSFNGILNFLHWYSREPSLLTGPKTFPSTSNPFWSIESR